MLQGRRKGEDWLRLESLRMVDQGDLRPIGVVLVKE